MTFSVPTWLEPHLGGQIWLQLGLAIVPLPAPVGPGDASAVGPDEAAVGPDDEMLVDRRARTAEMAALRARERQAEAEVIVAELTIRAERLERELEQARREPERLRKVLAERDQQRRAADQRAHAERALRLELAQELEQRPRTDSARARIEAGELATAEARIRELEQELATARRQADEAEQVAAAARRPAAVPAPAPAGPRPFDLRQELAVALRRRRVSAAPPAPPPERAPATGTATAAERRALRRERELVAPRKPPGSPSAAQAPPTPPAPPASADELELSATLAELRAELDQLAEIAERESAAREAAQSRVEQLERRVAELEQALRERELSSARVYDAVHELRSLLGQARGEAPAAPPPSADPQPASELERERFDAALSRLRASAPPEPEPGELPDRAERAHALPPATNPWLHPVLKRLTARDPVTAGRLLIGLLPAQGALHPAAIAYDLVLGDRECIQVTLGDPPATAQIVAAEEPRADSEVAFRVTGGYAELARLAFGGRLRERLRRGGARVIGDRGPVRALIGLERAQLGLEQLYDAGVRLDPTLAFMLAAATVEPRWTVSERFTIAHESGVPAERATYLHVRRGEALTVSDTPPLGPVATTIVCSGELVLAVLAGELGVDATIQGDSAPLLALLGWLERAQRG